MEEALSTDQVYATLQAAISLDNASRTAAEAQLQTWEADSAPGFIGSLLRVALEVQAVPEESRLLAVVVAKNAVGSSWRKTVGSREWSRVPDDEKAYVRSSAMRVLLQDPSERVALQAGLLVTNLARFDVPRPWDALLPELAAAAALDSALPLQAKVRALKALKHVLGALRNKRFVLEAPPGVSLVQTDELEALSQQIDADRSALHAQEKALLGGLRSQWESNFSALLQRGEGWEVRGALAAAGLSAIRELLLAMIDLRGVEADFDAMLSGGAQAAGAIAAPLFSGPVAAATASNGGGGGDAHTSLLSKCWERLLQCALVAMDRYTVPFAAHLPAWATLCVHTGLLGMDAAAVHAIRAKSRVLLTRFMARALLQPLYHRGQAQAEEMGGMPLLLMRPSLRGQVQAARPQLDAAADCLVDMLSEQEGRCMALVQAVVSKYIVLAPEELAEWEADPEGFARQVDVETSPDADTPRPCGVALLECMLERAEEPVSAALVSLAASLQAQPLSHEGVLPREATYRAIGEVFTHLRSRVDFNLWYGGELRGLLAGGAEAAGAAGMEGSVLRARALWLVGVCGEELRPEPWGDAFALAVQHIAAADVVVALMAVSAVTALVGEVLDEEQFVGQPLELQRLRMGGPAGFEPQLAAAVQQQGDLAAQAAAEFNAHMEAVESCVDGIMAACFSLLPRLGEAESMIRVLQCVSATVELMGDRVRPHLGTITAALPQVWGTIVARAGEGTGALARLHASLIATLAHLIAKLGAAAMAESQVAAVLLPLLHHATNLANPEAEVLLDDGLKLWVAVLQASAVLPPAVVELLPQRLVPLLARGRDNAMVFRIAEGYALHGGREAVTGVLPQLAAAVHSSIRAVLEAAMALEGRQGGPYVGASAVSSLLPPEVSAEGIAATSLLSLLQRLFDPLPGELEAPVRDAAAIVAQDYGGGVMRLPPRSVGLLDACLEIVCRLLFKEPGAIGALTGGDVAAQDRLVDRWVLLSTSRDVGELFMPALGVAGRVKRHNAAVALCALLAADACPGLRVLERAAQALVLGLKAAREQRTFERDQQRLAEAQPADPEHQDQLLLRRMQLARADPLRGVDAVDAVRAAGGHVAGWAGQERLMAALEAVDPPSKGQLAALLAGTLPEDQEAAAIQSMQHAALY